MDGALLRWHHPNGVLTVDASFGDLQPLPHALAPTHVSIASRPVPVPVSPQPYYPPPPEPPKPDTSPARDHKGRPVLTAPYDAEGNPIAVEYDAQVEG